MLKVILLDDERDLSDIKWIAYPEHAEVIVIRTYKPFVEYINSIDSLKDLLFTFDHDIQDFYNKPYSDRLYEYTGLDCAKYLIEAIMDRPELDIKDLNYVVHSMNPVGRENIISYIESYKKSLEI